MTRSPATDSWSLASIWELATRERRVAFFILRPKVPNSTPTSGPPHRKTSVSCQLMYRAMRQHEEGVHRLAQGLAQQDAQGPAHR